MPSSAAAEQEAPSTRFAKDQLKAIIERIEKLEEEKKATSEDIRDVYAEAKGNGFDAKALRALLDGAPGTMPSEDELREASEVVRRDHSFDARAATLVETVERLRARRR